MPTSPPPASGTRRRGRTSPPGDHQFTGVPYHDLVGKRVRRGPPGHRVVEELSDAPSALSHRCPACLMASRSGAPPRTRCRILSPAALAFLADLELSSRAPGAAGAAGGACPGWPQAPRWTSCRRRRTSDAGEWRVAGDAHEPADRRVEDHRPPRRADRRPINGARTRARRCSWRTWRTRCHPPGPQAWAPSRCCWDAVNRQLDFTDPEGSATRRCARPPTLWSGPARRAAPTSPWTGTPSVPGSLDLGLFLFHAGRGGDRHRPGPALGPYVYLPKPSALQAAPLDRRVRGGASGPGYPRGTIPADRVDRDHLGPCSRWTRSCTSCGGTRRRLKPHAPLELHLQPHQGVSGRPIDGPAGPRAGDDGRAVHACLRSCSSRPATGAAAYAHRRR